MMVVGVMKMMTTRAGGEVDVDSSNDDGDISDNDDNDDGSGGDEDDDRKSKRWRS